jgi:hypothetical protein
MDLLVDTMRVRGASAARLARVATGALPHALERALVGVPDGRIEAISIELALDPGELDDVALATIWADAIRAELVRELAGARAGGPDAVVASRRGSGSRLVSMEWATRAAKRWLDTGDRAGPVPIAALQLGAIVESEAAAGAAIPAVAARLVVELGERLWRPVRTVAAAPESPSVGATDDVPEPIGPAPATTDMAGVDAEASAPSARREADKATDIAVPQTRVREAATRVAAVAELAAEAGTARPAGELALDSLTDAAGLSLLYPWLADHCRAAVDLHPGLDPVVVRTHALAALVDPDDPRHVHDPFVALLAGQAIDDVEQIRLSLAEEVRAAADEVLASFASLLPGFAGSSPDFVRAEWIQRIGVLDTAADPVRLTARSHPLDVVLPQLPYPLALFRLPWSPPVSVRFRP